MTIENTETNEPVLEADDNSNNSDMVDVHEASIEDLDSALKNAQEEETNSSVTPESDSTVTEDTPPSTPPVEQPDLSAKAPNTAVAPTGADPSKPLRQYTPEEIQGIQAENERLKKQGDQKELFIQHRSNELGALKTQLAAAKNQLATTRAQLANGLEDRWSENPTQAANDRDTIKQIDQQLLGIDGQEEEATRIVEAQTFFVRNVDMEKVSLDDVAEVLKSDGIEDRYIAEFKANPWKWTTPEALVQMGKRAMDRKLFSEADNDRRILAKHVMFLNSELTKLKGKPGQVMKQIQKNLNQSPSITAASAASPKTARDVDPTKMTVAELDAALRSAGMH